VSKQTYHPGRGDVIHVNFSPSAGREFGLPHYGLVISSSAFSRQTGMCICLPMTTKHHAENRLHETPLMARMPVIKGLHEQGWVYIHQIKTIDFRERGAAYVGKIGEDDLDFLIDVMERVRALIDPDSIV
jgi:mRNA-degrading endonuclease toxin of MazEF toxin-antitoxin module